MKIFAGKDWTAIEETGSHFSPLPRCLSDIFNFCMSQFSNSKRTQILPAELPEARQEDRPLWGTASLVLTPCPSQSPLILKPSIWIQYLA